ncbi:histidine phosphatase family protein [Vibrio salilacus]|uniref:histidine phosphatase family protein n=1 Tax=Vibrio salilacus TaxID=1323749 RepID=UPI000C29E91D|nr:histidine phosphatase family protein [Vibrio salilacus]
MKQVTTINVYLLRHGKTAGLPALYGHTDIGVADEIQAAMCQNLLAQSRSFSALQTSPLKRCQDLAKRVVSNQTGLSYQIKSQWREISFGDLDGVPFEQAEHAWPLLEAFWQDPANNPLPGAESLQEFHHRVSLQWQEFCEAAQQDTLIICHGGTIRMIIANVLQLDWRNPTLYSALSIGHQTLTHIQITRAEQLYTRVCSIGAPLTGQ